MKDFSIFKNRYFIKADFILENPIHIGKGVSLAPTGTDLPVIKTPEDLPYIPGSSVKGVFRSEFERIIRTFESLEIILDANIKLGACNIFVDTEKCISQEKLEQLKEKCRENGKINDEKFTREILDNSCTVCKLFGSTEIASRIYFKDMFLNIKDISLKTEIRDGIAIDRDTGTTKKGAKFDYEIVPSKYCFKFEVILENVEIWQVQLFSLMLKEWEKGNIAIGGKKSIGLGFGKLQNIEIKKIEAKDILEYLIDDKKEIVKLDQLIENFNKKIKGGKNA